MRTERLRPRRSYDRANFSLWSKGLNNN